MIRPLPVAELAAALAGTAPESGVPGLRLFLFDTRPAGDYLAGHIPGARHLPHEYAVRWIPQRCHTQDLIVLVDALGAPGGPARQIAAELTHFWFRSLRFVEGGLAAWTAAGKPLAQGGSAGPEAGSHDGCEAAFKASRAVPWQTP